MQKHTMTFSAFIDKADATYWIRENIEPDDIDDCLTHKKIIFFTGCELTKHQVRQIELNCRFASYNRSDS